MAESIHPLRARQGSRHLGTRAFRADDAPSESCTPLNDRRRTAQTGNRTHYGLLAITPLQEIYDPRPQQWLSANTPASGRVFVLQTLRLLRVAWSFS